MINIDMRAISVQVEHLIHSVTQQFDVVGDHQDTTGESLDPIA